VSHNVFHSNASFFTSLLAQLDALGPVVVTWSVCWYTGLSHSTDPRECIGVERRSIRNQVLYSTQCWHALTSNKIKISKSAWQNICRRNRVGPSLIGRFTILYTSIYSSESRRGRQSGAMFNFLRTEWNLILNSCNAKHHRISFELLAPILSRM